MNPRVSVVDGVFLNVSVPPHEPETPEGAKTLLQVLRHNRKAFANKPSLGTIKGEDIQYMTVKEVFESAEKLAVFLEGITESDDIVGLYSLNRPEWIIGEYASYFAHCCNCPIYSTFTPDALRHIFTETELKVLIASADKASALLNSVMENGTMHLKHLILMDENPELEEKYRKRGIATYNFKEIMSRPLGHPARPEPSVDDIATICYTSGTSGVPKGVILTHKNFMAPVSDLMFNKNPANSIVLCRDKDVYLSYLPLPHVLERVCFLAAFSTCCRIVFFRGNPKLLQEDLKVAKPTFLVTVPRVLNIFMEKIKATVASKNIVLRALFALGLKFKIWRQKSGVHKNWLLDKLIFSKVSREFGGMLETSLCGGASLNPSVLQYIQAVLSINVFQGYGQTEGLAANIVSPLDVSDPETVGIPFPSVQVKLGPLKDYNDKNTGEILLKGPSVTQGYYKRPDETKKIFTEDGWLRTGDIGKFDNGYFYIVGRVKEIFKTSFGEYIVPEQIENLLVGGIVEDIFISGTEYSDFLIAIVVCLDPSIPTEKIVAVIKERSEKAVSQDLMKRFAVPSHFIVINDPFQSFDEGNLITPSMKKRRNLISAYFKERIAKEYSSGKKY